MWTSAHLSKEHFCFRSFFKLLLIYATYLTLILTLSSLFPSFPLSFPSIPSLPLPLSPSLPSSFPLVPPPYLFSAHNSPVKLMKMQSRVDRDVWQAITQTGRLQKDSVYRSTTKVTSHISVKLKRLYTYMYMYIFISLYIHCSYNCVRGEYVHVHM